MRTNDALVTGDDLNYILTVASGSSPLSGNKCETVQEINDHYYVNKWAFPYRYLSTNRLPIYQWLLSSNGIISNIYSTDNYTGECYCCPNQYENNKQYTVDFAYATPGTGRMDVTYYDSSGQSFTLPEGITSYDWFLTCGCVNDCVEIQTVNIYFD
jgi:hypothetical protein